MEKVLDYQESDGNFFLLKETAVLGARLLYKGGVPFQSGGFLVKKSGITWRKCWMVQRAELL